MSKKKGLGRGLSALIPEPISENNDVKEPNSTTSAPKEENKEETKIVSPKNVSRETSKSLDEDTKLDAQNKVDQERIESEVGSLQMLRLDEIKPDPNQPRKEFDPEALQGLADSIHSQGLLQPLVVNKLAKGKYQIVAGERRWRAAKLAGLDEVPCLVRDLEDEETLQVSLIENIQREDLNVIEEAEAYRRLTEDFYYTHQEVSRLVGKSRSHISNTLRLLQLPKELRQYLIDGSITPGHARALLSLPSVASQRAVIDEIKNRHLNVRQTERLVDRYLKSMNQDESDKPEKPKQDAQFLLAVQSVEDELSHHLGTKVRLKAGKNRGQIVIDYYNHEDLERIFEVMGLKDESWHEMNEQVPDSDIQDVQDVQDGENV